MLREFSSEHRDELKAAVGKTPADQAKADAVLALLGDATFWNRLRMVSIIHTGRTCASWPTAVAASSCLPASVPRVFDIWMIHLHAVQLKGYLAPVAKAVNEAQADTAGLADVMAVFLRLRETFASFSNSDVRRTALNALEVSCAAFIVHAALQSPLSCSLLFRTCILDAVVIRTHVVAVALDIPRPGAAHLGICIQPQPPVRAHGPSSAAVPAAQALQAGGGPQRRILREGPSARTAVTEQVHCQLFMC